MYCLEQSWSWFLDLNNDPLKHSHILNILWNVNHCPLTLGYCFTAIHIMYLSSQGPSILTINLYFSVLTFTLSVIDDIHLFFSWVLSRSFSIKGYCTPGPYLWRFCAFSQKIKATSDKVSYGSGQKCSKELKNHSFNLVETIVVKLQWKMCQNQYFPCFEP